MKNAAYDQLGVRPIINARGTLVANTIEEFVAPPPERNTKQLFLNEKGAVVNGRGDNPNMHDILTGSKPDGRSFNDTGDHTVEPRWKNHN